MVAKLNGNSNKVGPALVLKVMCGDKVTILTKAFYKSGGTANEGGNPLTDILTSLAAGIIGVAGESKGTLSALSNATNSPLLGALGSFRSGNNPSQATKPKAYLNWILLDEQFNYVAASSGADPVKSADVLGTPSAGTVNMTKNGYLYIYVSNETQNWDVFFDNLVLQHYTGPITEETHYYPFGLTMAGISCKALRPNYTENKKKFNGIEHNTDFNLNMYDAFYRNLDPQIGRFWQIDPRPNYMESPYAAMKNNPIHYNDPMGDTVRTKGFTNQEVLGFLAKGLKIEEKASPFYFNKKGDLRYNQKNYNNLSKTQKAIADNIIGDIKSKKLHNIIKSTDQTITEKGKIAIHKSKTFGDIPVQQPDQKVGDRAGVTAVSEDGKTVNHFINMQYFETHTTPNADGALDKDGNALPQHPWLTTFHEVGGHGYLRYNENDPQQGGHTIDYENLIRVLHGMTPRAYDKFSHKEPPKE